jgi:adenylate kinase family enzyme
MGAKNYLIEGVSGTGKTAVAQELQRRGYHVIHGDRELAYRGYPESGEPLNDFDLNRALDDPEWAQGYWLWDVAKVKSLVADHSAPISFFCGGSRNFPRFIDLFDRVFVLEVADLATLLRRIDQRVAVDPTDWGAKPEEKALIARQHAMQDVPNGQVINATVPLAQVVDGILSHCT